MSQPQFSDRSRGLIVDNIRSIVESSSPDLTKSVLYMLRKNRGATIENISRNLDLLEEYESVKIVVDRLTGNSLIERAHSTRNGRRVEVILHALEEDVDLYFQHAEPLGPYNIFEDHGLDQETTLKVMDSISNMVEFTYSRNFKLSLDRLRESGEESHKALKLIREKESKFIYNELGVPRAFTNGLPSFVSENDPTKNEAYDIDNFTLTGNFKSPESAFVVGFDKAIGTPTLYRKYKTQRGETNFLPSAVKIDKVGTNYNVNLNNMRYDITESSFAYQQEAKRILPILEERIAEALDS